MKAFLGALALVFLTSMSANAAVIFVPDDYSTITAALEASSSGDSIIVRPGVYEESVGFPAHPVTLKSGCGPEETTIREPTGLWRVVVFPGGLDENSVLDGFTLTGGKGGISVTHSSPTIINNYITGNSVPGESGCGGGISSTYADPVIIGNTITGNYAQWYGPGIYLHQSKAVITNNIISNNYGGNGAGICCMYSSHALISYNEITGNNSSSGGGICIEYYSSPIMIGNLIQGNQHGGISTWKARPYIVSNTIVDNIASFTGAGVSAAFTPVPLVVNSIVWGNGPPGSRQITGYVGPNPDVTYTNTYPSYSGVGNISVEPQFRDPLNMDFHLMAIECGDAMDSPCIDAGHPDSVDISLDCFHGLQTARVDMGCYAVWEDYDSEYEVYDCRDEVDLAGSVSSACGEGPLGDIPVTLTDDLGNQLGETLTAADGSYSFADIDQALGIVFISVTAPASFECGDPLNVDLTADPASLGEIDIALTCVYVDISGIVSSDCGDSLEGVAVTLTDAGGDPLGNAVTLADGTYTIEGIRFSEIAGQISIAVPAGFEAIDPEGGQSPVGLTENQIVDFSCACVYVDVSGTVSVDCQGTVEPFEGVTVTLTDGNGDPHETLTGAEGSYGFTGIHYSENPSQVSVTVPPGFEASDPPTGEATVDLTTGQSGVNFTLACVFIAVSGTVTSDCAGPLLGITVDLDVGDDLFTTTTDENGAYVLPDVPYSTCQNDNISIVIPLGFEAVNPPDGGKLLILDQSQIVNFTVACLDPTGEARSMGYWKHQANVYLKNKGHAHESEADMTTNFPNAIFNHFYENEYNGIQVEGVTYILEPDPGDPSVMIHVPITLETIQATLTVRGNQPMVTRAKQQYMAFLLNMASGKLLSQSVISEDGGVASQALQQVATYIGDGDPSNDEVAKDIADAINNAELVPAGIVDLDLPIIYYRDDAPYAQLPTVTMFSGIAPSPFRESSMVRFQLNEASPVKVRIYSATGRLVRELLNEELPAGYHSVPWDARDHHGRPIAQGIYYVRLQTAGYGKTKRAVVLR
jgi:hypothetical protein